MTRRPASTPARIYLVRHGETEWNGAGRFQGGLDSPLTELGIAQAAACGRRLAAEPRKIDAIFASPLGRTRHTNEIIRAFGDYPQTRWDVRLREISLGCWDGLTRRDIDAGWADRLNGSSRFNWYFRSPDGESYDAAAERVRDWLDEVEGTVVAISHGLIGRIIRGVYLGLAREETLGLPVRQDVIWQLAGGAIAAVGT